MASLYEMGVINAMMEVFFVACMWFVALMPNKECMIDQQVIAFGPMIAQSQQQVESTFQESVCEAYGVDDEEDLPKEIQEIDVVKFAQLSSSNISSVVVRSIDVLFSSHVCCLHLFRPSIPSVYNHLCIFHGPLCRPRRSKNISQTVGKQRSPVSSKSWWHRLRQRRKRTARSGRK
jgi:hypothetical protein